MWPLVDRLRNARGVGPSMRVAGFVASVGVKRERALIPLCDAATAAHCATGQSPGVNRHLRIMFATSISSRAAQADAKDLNPCIGRTRFLMVRWPCATPHPVGANRCRFRRDVKVVDLHHLDRDRARNVVAADIDGNQGGVLGDPAIKRCVVFLHAAFLTNLFQIPVRHRAADKAKDREKDDRPRERSALL